MMYDYEAYEKEREEKRKKVKKGLIGGGVVAFVLLIGIGCAAACIEKIPNGYCGVQYSMNGGIKDEVLTQGWHFVSPFVHVKEFTVANEQLVMSKDARDGSESDDSFNVATADDASIAISFRMEYAFIQDELPDTFKRYRGMSGEDIVNNRVRGILKSKISEVTTNYTMMDIYSGNRSEINRKILNHLNEEFKDTYGITVINADIIDVHPDAQLQQTIDNRVKALQQKQEAQAKQETAKVEAETELIKAKNAADIEITKAKAEAEANRVISESITQGLIDMKNAEARMQHGWVTIKGANTVVTK